MANQKIKNDIQSFLHCRNCLDKRPNNVSPREWVHLETGFTIKGLQIFCVRCELNVCALDFLGQKIAYDDKKWHKPKLKKGVN